MKQRYLSTWLLDQRNHLKTLPQKKVLALLLAAACLSQGPVKAAAGHMDAANAFDFTARQTTEVKGRVTGSDGQAVPGATVVVKGTTLGTATDVNGNFSLNVPSGSGTLVVSFIGYKTQEVPINNRTSINVRLVDDAKALQEVVVTGYTTQEKRDIIGAVSVVAAEDLLATPAPNVQQQLQGRVSGVTTTGTGQPGAGAKVRVRGFGSFGANDPLYVVDGVPTFSINEINPNDIESLQVLKDASSASIYGARAANGVVIVTTKKGKSGTSKLNVSSFYGTQIAPKGPDFLNPTEYAEYLFKSYTNAGQAFNHPQYGTGQPTLPNYLLPAGAQTVDESKYSLDPNNFNQIVKANKEGTDWWNEVFDPASIQSHQIGVTGGSENSTYAVSFNYFDQEGIAKYTEYKRYTVRANTQATIAKRFRIGENLQISYNHGNVGNTGGGESDIQHIYVMQSIVPVYDIRGNFAGTRGSQLGNARNPVAELFRQRDNKNSNFRMFGNMFAEVDLIKGLTARTSFGADYGSYYGRNFTFSTYERAENIGNNNFAERNDNSLNWVWTNTLTLKRQFGEDHDLTALIGSEAVKNTVRGVGGSRVGLFSTDPDFRVLNSGTSGLTNFSYGGVETLSSLFARIDYGFRDKYLFNATVRRDGSSKFGSNYRYGTFPAVGFAWRISDEDFMSSIPAINDLKLRAGYGQLGNQLPVPSSNAFTLYRTAVAGSAYDIAGTSTSVQPGFDTDRIGNEDTKWEASTTTNIGLDLALWNSALTVTLDAYNRRTNDLLVQSQAAAPVGVANLPFINLGDIQNKGIDVGITYTKEITSDLSFDVTLNASRYKNEVLRVGDNDNAFFESYLARWGQNISRTQKGQPLGSFYGYVVDGFFNNASDLDDLVQPGEHIGGWKFKDLNNDGEINGSDRTFIGNPHPDFTTGFNLNVRFKNFDFNTFLYASVGNDVFNYSKYFTDFNTFQGNRSKRKLYESWTPENMDATLPILRIDDTFSNSVTHSYYVEDGSFLRARTIQLGYTLPASLTDKISMGTARVYLQAQNLFTITAYQGIDPDISFINQGGNAAQADLNIGIDPGGYVPNPKQFLIGVNFGF
ncbi:SusC/RagA family TonB-linked outer membrane protein [Pontibacter sp. CAU 1760]